MSGFFKGKDNRFDSAKGGEKHSLKLYGQNTTDQGLVNVKAWGKFIPSKNGPLSLKHFVTFNSSGYITPIHSREVSNTDNQPLLGENQATVPKLH